MSCDGSLGNEKRDGNTGYFYLQDNLINCISTILDGPGSIFIGHLCHNVVLIGIRMN